MSRLNEFMNDLTLDKIFGVILMMLGIALLVLGVVPAIEKCMVLHALDTADFSSHFSLIHLFYAGIGFASFFSGLSIVRQQSRKRGLHVLDEGEVRDEKID